MTNEALNPHLGCTGGELFNLLLAPEESSHEGHGQKLLV